ncbi:hypothetical protein VCHENC02_0450B, partial [Vibrio harveyi]
LDKNQSNF